MTAVVLAALAITLALTPFEGIVLPRLTLGDLPIVSTDLTAAGGLTVLAWALLLLVERRRPWVPGGVLVAVTSLALVTGLSAATAGPNAELGAQVTARAAVAWGLFLVAADLVRFARTAVAVLAVPVAVATVSALTGLVAAWNGSMDGLFGAGRLFQVGDVERMAGTWDYPTIAAMAWTSLLLVVLPLLAVGLDRRPERRLAAAVLVAVVVVLGSCVLLTYTRGAFLGLAAGLAVLLLVAWRLRSRALAAIAMGAGAALVIGVIALYLRSPLPLERLTMESDRGLYGARYAVTGDLAAAPSSRVEVDIIVTNTGIATWRPDGAHPWVLGALWIDPQTLEVVAPHRTVAQLPGPVAPGTSVALRATIDVPASPGQLDLAWDMVQLDVVDFSERDVPVALTRVTVDAEAATRPVPVSAPTERLLYPAMLPTVERVQLWTAAVRLIAKHPILGVGPGAYRRLYGPEIGLSRWDTRVHSNNMVLELAATTGLVGLAAFLASVVLAARRQWRALAAVTGPARPRPPTVALVMAGSLAATAAAFGHGLVDHFLVFAPMAILFWVLLGVGLGVAGGVGRGPTRAPQRPVATGGAG